MSETALSARALPGWYGKLPHLGDFASRRLPQGFVQGWDAWLGQGLAAARAALGPLWQDRYLVAPVVRFWLAPALLDGRAWTGLAMPSVDRVGRHFPLTIAFPGGPLAQALAETGRLDALEAVARRVLDVDFRVEDFEQALAEAQAGAAPRGRVPPVLPHGTCGSAWWWSAGTEAEAPWHSCRFDALPPPAAFVRLLEALP